MTAVEVLHMLQERDMQLIVDGEQLRYDAPASAVTAEVMTLLLQHKKELLAMLVQASPAITSPEPLTRYYPCVVCGRTKRWDDHGIWRCVACWPQGQQKASRIERVEV
jgi:hypothetical protein